MRYFAPRRVPNRLGDRSLSWQSKQTTVVALAVIGVVIVALAWMAVPLEREQAGSPAPMSRSAADGARPTSVVTVPARWEDFAHEVEAIGTARANESINVTAKISNTVAAIRFEEGEWVSAGKVLVELDGTQARAELAIADAALKESRSQFNRSRELFATKALSEAQLEQLEATLLANEARVAAARSRLEDTVIRAPFAGRVGLRRVSLGSLVSPGEVITTLDDLSVIKLDFAVPETFLATLAPGLAIRARSPAYPNEIFEGRVASLDSRVDPVSRAVTVRARLDNRDGRLKPGMFMTVTLVRMEGRALMLPEQALVPEQDRQYVFRVRDSRAVKTEVQTGRRRPGQVEIVSGLDEGDSVVVEGTLKLRDGAPVEILVADGSRGHSP